MISDKTLKSENREYDLLRRAVISVEDLFLVTDAQGQIVFMNESGLSMYGCKDLREVMPLSVNSILDKPVFNNNCEESCHYITQHPVNALIARNDQLVNVLLSASLMRDEKGSSDGMILIAKKAESSTEERDASYYRESFEKAVRELDEFTYVVSHDLKAPLRAIFNLTDWIAEDLGEDISEDIKKNVALLKRRVGRMESLINGLVKYSRILRSKEAYSETNLDELLDRLIKGLPAEKPLKIVRTKPLPVLLTNQNWMEQIFSNLIENALAHAYSSSLTIEVSWKENDAFFEFEVKDNGPGIAPEFQEKIFGIFQTLKARDEHESAGVGLCIVKKIVEELGGKIWIESKAGAGTSFLFTIAKNKFVK